MSKLYTEEQVRNLTEAAFMAGQNHNPFIFQIELNKLTQIELPTDEKIEKVAEKKLSVNFLSFIEGAKWMRDIIKGGNNE